MANLYTKTVPTGTITQVVPPGRRLGYRITVVSGSACSFAFGETGATELTVANGNPLGIGQTHILIEPEIARHGVHAIAGLAEATVGVELFH